MKEIWKDIDGWKGYYQVSSLGRVKSVNRYFIRKNGHPIRIKERILKPCLNRGGYLSISLCKKMRGYTKEIHLLVAKAFVRNRNPNRNTYVNHLDNIKENNIPSNLEWCTNRENITHGFQFHKRSSKYTGVISYGKKWSAGINVNGKFKNLGYFDSEIKASLSYKKEMIKHKIKNKYAIVA